MLNNKLLFLLTSALLFGCGGGSDNKPVNQPDSSENLIWVSGTFEAASKFKDYCESPRLGNFPDRSGTSMHEKMWLRSWANDSYLWYEEVDDIDPTPFNVSDYFAQLRTTEKDEFTGKDKDNFHFTRDTEEYRKQTQAGVSLSYGMSLKIISKSPPRKVVVSYVEPNSIAEANGVIRGDEVIQINDVDVINSSDVDIINAGLFPSNASQEYRFKFEHVFSGVIKTVSMRPSELERSPVLNVKTIQRDDDNIGYFQFNTHNSPSEKALRDTIAQLSASNIDDLIIDLRYNGGGLLAVSSQLAYMVAGSSSNNKTFELLQFNDKYPNTNPVTGERIDPIPFFNQTLGLSDGLTSGLPLPTLNLNRVYVLTTDNTCSASEALMNGLRGIDVEVIQIGGKTCGKPYGFYPVDNCGITYFNVQFQGVNHKGFGSYASGFEPKQASPITGFQIPGCLAVDDFNHQLGDESETMLSSALHYRSTGSCPIIAASSVSKVQNNEQGSSDSRFEISDPAELTDQVMNNKIY
ncbi:peptidase [Shewanella sp. OPT22]|nr:peptidase [Shewanella sp. OPT22]